MDNLVKFDDWRARLAAYIESVAARPAVPGTFDCALLAAGGVEAQTGVDLARDWRGYTSYAEGRRQLLKAGYRDQADLAARHLVEIAPSFAAVGDVAVVLEEGEPSLCLVQGAYLWAVGEDRVGLIPLRRAVRAFRV